MRVKIDYDLCMGDGNCAKACPEIFEYDDDKLLWVVKNSDVPSALEAKVRQAAEDCMPRAIVIDD